MEAGKTEKGVEEVEGELLLLSTGVGAEESTWAEVVDCGGMGTPVFKDSGSAPVLLFWPLCRLTRVLVAELLEAAEPAL